MCCTKELMGRFSCMLNGLLRFFSVRKVNNYGREAVEAMAKEAKKNGLILRSSGIVNVDASHNFASVFSNKGEKGVNQDSCIVWEQFGCQPDMIFCGIFDGHGAWGHFVAKRVRESMPPSLLCNWQEAVAQTSLHSDMEESDKNHHWFDIWKHSYLKTCGAIDEELEQCQKIDSFYSGTTALSIVRQGDVIVIANVGDSRAVMGTTSDDGRLLAVQLTVDMKPNIPEEAQRIRESNGRVLCLDDEAGVDRVWMPNGKYPGLAMSRAFGDHCMKKFGVISVPEVTQRDITSRDEFVLLATDGVWDVISNEEGVEMVGSTSDRAKAAKKVVECAARAWKRKRPGIAMDDISAICLFFHSQTL